MPGIASTGKLPRRGAARPADRQEQSAVRRAAGRPPAESESAQIEGVVNLKRPACFTSESYNPSHGVLLPSSWFAGRPCTVTAYTGPGRIHGPDSIIMIRAGLGSSRTTKFDLDKNAEKWGGEINLKLHY